jgi:hypothetical protein
MKESVNKKTISKTIVKKKSGLSFTSGIIKAKMPHHNKLPITRRVLVSNDFFNDCNVHIAVHYVKGIEKNDERYTQLHTHEVDEINLILGNEDDDGLVYRVHTDSEEFTLKSPQAVYIPKGTPHAAEVIKGKGMFLCIVFKGSLE